ncbi:MAG: hypothetical protein ACSLFR_11440 [Solirubrobacteraceae bacterium]
MIDLGFLDPSSSTAAPHSPVDEVPRAGLTDRSLVAKTELQVGPADAAALTAAVETATGVAPKLGRAVEAAGAWWCPVTPTRVLVIGDPPAAVTAPVSAVTVTSGFVAVSLSGGRARDVLARVSALDLRRATEGSLLPGSVARIPAIVVCERDDALLVLAGSAHARYLWDTLVDAGEPLGLVPLPGERQVIHA